MNLQIHVLPDWWNLGLQLGATLVLFLVVRAKLFKPVRAMLDKRNNYIETNIAQSEQNKDEVENLKNAYEDQLKEARQEARQIVADAKKKSDEIVTSAADEAKAEVKRIYDKNSRAMELEREKILGDIQEEVVDMAILAAEKVVKGSMDDQKNRNLVNDFIQGIGEKQWKN